MSLMLTLIQNGNFCPLKLLPQMTELSVFMPLHGLTPADSYLGCISLKDYKIIWKTEVRRDMKTKECLEALIILWIKWTGMVEIKNKDFIDVIPINPCQNS